jgi:hypothetical protein
MVGCSFSSKSVVGQEKHSGEECHTFLPIRRLNTIGPQNVLVWNTEVTHGGIPLTSPRYTKNAAWVSAPFSAIASLWLRHPNVEAVGWLRESARLVRLIHQNPSLQTKSGNFGTPTRPSLS